MRRLIRSVLAVLIFLPSPPAPAAGFVSTLGISFIWDIGETKKAFAKAGIAPKDFSDNRQLELDVKQMTGGLLLSLAPMLIVENITLGMTDFTRISPQECLYYENALEPRDDIALVAIYFYGKERQVLIVPFFREDKVDGATLRRCLTEEYGDLVKNKANVEYVQGVHISLWLKRPWFYAGLLASKYAFLFEMPSHMPKFSGISSIVTYVNAGKLLDAAEDLEAEDDAAKAAAEKAKQETRKGL